MQIEGHSVEAPNSNLEPERATWAGAALLMLVTVLVYLPSMRAGFIWDDDTMLTQNPAVKSADGLYSIWLTSWSGDYVPLTTSSFWLEWHLWQANPAGHHLINILLHAANAALLWRVLARLRVTGAWLAALLFAIHPVCAASVTWIAERKNTLSMLLYLSSLLWFLRDDESIGATTDANGWRPAIRGQAPWFWRSLGAFALALLAKSSVAILPPVLLWCLWWRRGPIRRQDFARTLPFFALALALSVVAISIQHKALHTGAPVSPDRLLARLIGGGWALWFYLEKILLPANLTMIYQRWKINPGNALCYAPFFLFAAMIVLFWWNRRGWGRPWLFAFGYFVIALSPVLGFFNMAFYSNSQVADHLQYLAMPSILALIAAATQQSPRAPAGPKDEHSETPAGPPGGRGETRRRGDGREGAVSPAPPPGVGKEPRPILLAVVTPVAIAIVLSALTWRRESLLGSSQRLWEDNAVKNPTSWRVYMNLNIALLEQGKTNQAIQMYNKAMELFSAENK